MKTRVLAIMLGLSLCVSPLAEVSAADLQITAFSDGLGDGSSEAPAGETDVMEFPSEDVQPEQTQTDVPQEMEELTDADVAGELVQDGEIVVPEEGVQIPEENIPAPEEGVQVPEENVPAPEEEVQVPEENVPAPEEGVQVPEENVPVPEEGTQVPEEEISVPEEEIPIPEEIVPEPEEIPAQQEPAPEDPFNSGEGTADEIQVITVEEMLSVQNSDVPGSNTVNVVNWQPSEGRWKLMKSDQSGYYSNVDGLVEITTVENGQAVHKGIYLFDENCDMVVGRYKIPAGTQGYTFGEDSEFYFADADSAVVVGEASAEPTPWNSDLGQMKKKYWHWTGVAFCYYGADGRFCSVKDVISAQQKNKNYKGYLKINGKFYCLKNDGTPRTGNVKISGGIRDGQYYFLTKDESGQEIPGEMFHGGWHKETDSAGKIRYRFYTKAGAWIGSRKYAAVRGVNGTAIGLDDAAYVLSKGGYIMKNQCVKVDSGKTYMLDAQGRVRKNELIKIGNYRYYFGANGALVNWKNQWHRCPGAGYRYYYFGSVAGRVQEMKLWRKIGNDWYFFNAVTGDHYTSRALGNLYFKADGKLASGFTAINGKWYYFEPSTAKEPKGAMYRNGWFTVNNKYRCYVQQNGVAYCNEWAKIGDYWYYFLSNCAIQTNSFRKKDGVNGFLDSKGRYTTGWVIINNAKNLVRYIDPTGNGVVTNRSMEIDGLIYYFDQYGFRMNDVSSIVKAPYYVEVNRKTGVLTVFDANRTTPVKSMRVSVGLPGTSTPYGKYRLNAFSSTWVPLMGPSWGQYGTHVEGAGSGGIFIHSVASTLRNPHNVPVAEYNKLGSPASHGCIRACVRDAKWVYENCDGAVIWIRDDNFDYKVSFEDESLRGPLGRPARVPISGRTDPTDPLTNPY